MAKNEETEAALKKELKRDAAEARKNPKMCVYNTADGRCATVAFEEGEKMLESGDWVDSPAKVKKNDGGEVTDPVEEAAKKEAAAQKKAEAKAKKEAAAKAKADAEAAKKAESDAK